MATQLQEAVRALSQACPNIVLLGEGLEPKVIAQAEDQLGCQFGPEYAEFLLQFGWMETPMMELCGLVRKRRRRFDTVQDNSIFERERRKSQLLVIGAWGDELLLTLPVMNGISIESICVLDLSDSTQGVEHWANDLTLTDFVLSSISKHGPISG